MQCLPVAKRRPAEGTVTSWTAEEYLCAVREEANTCEGTSVAEGIEMQISTGHRDLVCPSWSFALSKEMKTDAEITHQQHQQHVELLERMAKNFTRAREVCDL